jgi:hypothetical protein
MEEIWKYIQDSHQRYQVSNLGRVKSFKQNKHGEILVGNVKSDGLHRIRLFINNKFKEYFTHHLVATHFISNPNNLSLVEHIDGNKLNNHVDNLQWIENKESKKTQPLQLENEEWKYIQDTNDMYQVSNLGRVKSFRKYKENGVIVNGSIYECGYNRMSIIINGKSLNLDTHRLVAKHFIPNPNNLPIVDHIDGNRSNNNVSNLRWVNHRQNAINSKIQKNNTSGFKGVQYHSVQKKWLATCMIHGKFTVKAFVNLNDAIECRKEWVRLYYPKEFYSTNDTINIVQSKIKKKEVQPLQLENEEWKYIQDTNNMYQVSNLGRIKSFKKYKDGKILNGNISDDDYIIYNLVINDKPLRISNHQLVAKHFIPNPYSYIIVDHINGDKSNNRVDNLRWVNESQNTLNSKISKRNTSGYKGVHREKNLWVASWVVNSVVRRKRFRNKEDAIEYRNKMVNIHYSQEHFIHSRE